jgi:hypothetical protein
MVAGQPCRCRGSKCTCACHPRDEVRVLTKAELQRSVVPIGHGHGTDYTTTSGAASRAVAASSAPEYTRAGPSELQDHTTDHVSLGPHGGTWDTTHRIDYVRKQGAGYERAKPEVDPYGTNLPPGDVPDAEWRKDALTSESRANFVKLPTAKRESFDPKLQGSHFSIGRAADKTDVA